MKGVNIKEEEELLSATARSNGIKSRLGKQRLESPGCELYKDEERNPGQVVEICVTFMYSFQSR